MESVRDHIEPNFDRIHYEYIPTTMLDTILNSLTVIPAPSYNSVLKLYITQYTSSISVTRPLPSRNSKEHLNRLAEWAMPPFLQFLKPKLIILAISLLMCEVKCIFAYVV
jgi:hypothetical protein